MRNSLTFLILLYVNLSNAFLSKLAEELGLAPDPLLSTFECTLHYQQTGNFEGGLSLLGVIHGRLESSPVSWLVYTKLPVTEEEISSGTWKAATMLRKHKFWCSVIFYSDFTGDALQEEFYDSISFQIYRMETILILIRDTVVNELIRDKLYAVRCLVFIELYRTKRFYYLERGKAGILFRSMPHTFSVVSILDKFPSRDNSLGQFFPGIVPTGFTDDEIGKCVCKL